MSLFSCLPWFATKAPPASGPADAASAAPADDPNDRAHRDNIATQLSACRRLACRHPDAPMRKELQALLGRAQDRFTQVSPTSADASRQIEAEEVRAHQLQRDLAPLLDQLSLKLSDEEIPLKGRLDALEGIAVVLGRWCTTQPIIGSLKALHDRIPSPDRHRAIRQAVANGDAAALTTGLNALQRRRPRPDPRELLSQTLRGGDDQGPQITLLAHAIARGHAEVAGVLTRTLTSLRRARLIDARDQINALKQALQPAVLHRAASSAHAAVSVKVCVDALCVDKSLQSASRRALPSMMEATIHAADCPEAFYSLLFRMCQTRQGRALAAQALEDVSREGLLGRLCRGDASVQSLHAYLCGLMVAARTGAVSGKALARLLLAPGQSGRPAIADARGQLRACMRRVLDDVEPRRLISADDCLRLRAAVGAA